MRFGLLFCVGALTLPLFAQKVVSARAGLISYLQGSAFLDGKRVVLKTARFPQMRDGQTLSTRGGRAELLLAPGVMLRLAENSQVRMEDTQLADTRVTLLQGEALIEVLQLPEGSRTRVAVRETTTELTRPGLYRFGTSQNATQNSTVQTLLRVYGGEALVRSGSTTADVKRGMSVDLDTNLHTGLKPDLAIAKFDRKQTDTLHDWAARRSFNLFISDPDARQKQTHWQISGSGYLENKNFGVVFRAYLRRGLPPPSTPVVRPAEKP